MAVEQIDQVDTFTFLFEVFRAARFEVAFVCGLALLYTISVCLRSGKSHIAPLKERARRRIGVDAVEPNVASEGKFSLGPHRLAAILESKDDRYLSNLKDPAWLIPRVVDACATADAQQAQQALQLYRKAQRVGLDLSQASRQDNEQLFTALVTSVIRLGFASEAKQLLEEFLASGAAVSSTLRTSIVKLCASRQLFQEALDFHDMCPMMNADSGVEVSHHERSVWSCLLFCAVEVKAWHRCRPLFARLKSSGGLPHQKDFWNMIRWASAQGQCNYILELMQEMKANEIEADNVLYNTALASCVTSGDIEQARRIFDEMESIGEITDVISYNTLMKGYAKIGKMDECFKVFESLRLHGHTPSQVTYGILLDGYINNNDVENAAKSLAWMQDAGCSMNTVIYTTIIKGFAREGKLADARRIYEQMIQNSVTPDLITYSVLLKANCDSGYLQEALSLFGDLVKSGFKPDEVIFNNLIAGCAHAETSSESPKTKCDVAKQIYENMTQSGISPSNATFSILVRVYASCKLLDEAVIMLKTEPQKHNVVLESRIFVQLIVSCIRARQGRRAVEVCKLMHEQTNPTPASMSSMLSAATKLNMYDTAAEIMACARDFNGRIDARDATMVIQAARKKRKDSCAESCIASMRALGYKGEL